VFSLSSIKLLRLMSSKRGRKKENRGAGDSSVGWLALPDPEKERIREGGKDERRPSDTLPLTSGEGRRKGERWFIGLPLDQKRGGKGLAARTKTNSLERKRKKKGGTGLANRLFLYGGRRYGLITATRKGGEREKRPARPGSPSVRYTPRSFDERGGKRGKEEKLDRRWSSSTVRSRRERKKRERKRGVRPHRSSMFHNERKGETQTKREPERAKSIPYFGGLLTRP